MLHGTNGHSNLNQFVSEHKLFFLQFDSWHAGLIYYKYSSLLRGISINIHYQGAILLIFHKEGLNIYFIT